MTPRDVRQHLAAYADGELPPEARAAIEAALAATPELPAEMARWQALRRALGRTVQSEIVPAGLAGRVRAGLAADDSPSAVPRFGRVYRLGLAGLSAAAVLILALFVWPRDAQATSLDVRGLAKIHRACAQDHRHDTLGVRGCAPRVACQKIKARTGFAGDVPDVSACGEYDLDGACQCSPARGVRAIHIAYRSKQAPERVLSVFAVERALELATAGGPCPNCTCGQRNYRRGTDADVTLVGWHQNGRSYVLVGPLSEPELVRLADQLKP